MTSFELERQITHMISKRHYFQENPKILRAIQNKTNPLKVNPKMKFKMQLLRESHRPTVHKFSYKGATLQNPIRNEEEQIRKKNKKNKDLYFIQDSLDGFRKAKKIIKSVNVRQMYQRESDFMNETQNIRAYRLPTIKRDLEQKKYQLAKSIQSNFIEFQRDSFRPIEEQKVCNLQYLMNRMSVCSGKSRIEGRKQQPLRGYENLSPNRLKEYIELFKHKMKAHPHSIYVSKKRIPLPKNNTEGNDSEEQINVRLKSICSRSDKRVGKVSKKQIQAKKGSRKSIVSRNQIKRSTEKKKTMKVI